MYPVAVLGNLHFASINDLTWIVTSDSHIKLIAASSDGFCSFFSFDLNEDGLTIFGERLTSSEVPEKLKGIYEA